MSMAFDIGTKLGTMYKQSLAGGLPMSSARPSSSGGYVPGMSSPNLRAMGTASAGSMGGTNMPSPMSGNTLDIGAGSGVGGAQLGAQAPASGVSRIGGAPVQAPAGNAARLNRGWATAAGQTHRQALSQLQSLGFNRGNNIWDEAGGVTL